MMYIHPPALFIQDIVVSLTYTMLYRLSYLP
jgi:hypothetical protein